ncbi:hypothetical protein FWK73_02305 [Listeria monocytogenes]|nr:hypothetical protein [Listeria monocytogenes]EAG5529712.1 hypothetical protein [Listeria monocytogenes]ECB9825153.1 hypothetical protein [Listeria monocytogenes]EDN9303178.1 hypothetical protein [Listeria monocytogenes]TYV63309.1 hypothetical protein FZ059_07510 [Listeria monocytogenes]
MNRLIAEVTIFSLLRNSCWDSFLKGLDCYKNLSKFLIGVLSDKMMLVKYVTANFLQIGCFCALPLIIEREIYSEKRNTWRDSS